MAVKNVLCHINNMGRGGAERVMSVLIDSMVNDGIDVTLVTLDKANDEYAVPTNVSRIEIDKNIPANKLRFINRILELRKLIKQNKPDIVLSFCSKENFRSSIALLGKKIPLVVSVRSNPVEHYGNQKFFTWLMSTKVSGCVFQSQGAREFFSDKLQKKSEIITNPIDKSYFDVKPHEVGEDESEIKIVTAGRLSEEKNQILLAQAFALLADKYTNVNLYLYGKDDHDGTSDKIRELIQEKHLEKRIQLMGACNTWAQELVKADIFVLPSKYEGMPNALMEAMTVGLAVVSTDCPCGGPASLIEDGVNGMLVPVDDAKAMAVALEKLIVDRKLREDVGQNALKIRDMVDTQTVYNQWKVYMESLI